MAGSHLRVRPRLSYDASSGSSTTCRFPEGLYHLQDNDEEAPVESEWNTVSSDGSTAKVSLDLNVVSLGELTRAFQDAPGFGPVSARKIIRERERGGLFASFSDLDRRVTGLTCRRLLLAFVLTFSDPSPPCASGDDTEEDECVRRLHNLSLRRSRRASGCSRHGRACSADVADDESELEDQEAWTEITCATFNACKLSPRVENFEKKLLMLQRFVEDTPHLDIILLQELYSNAAAHIAERLSKITKEQWVAVGCGSEISTPNTSHEHSHSYGRTCQGAVYRTSSVRCVASAYGESPHNRDAVKTGFKRAPHVCVFQKVNDDASKPSRLLCVANLHLSQRDPRSEIEQLDALLHSMHAGCARSLRIGQLKGLLCYDIVYLLAGDFNRQSSSADFRALKDSGFVELVAGEGPGPGVPALHDPTSHGGQRLDNMFMLQDTRSELLKDAWVYRIGGAGRRLGETAYASAGRLRSERSDHMPVVARLRLGESRDRRQSACSCPKCRTWVQKRRFVVELGEAYSHPHSHASHATTCMKTLGR